MALAALQFTVTDGSGNVVPGAHVEIKREVPGQPLAALKEDRAGLTGMVNPSDTDANGFFRCYLAGGAYQVRVYTGASGAPTFEAPIRRYVAVGLTAESDEAVARTPLVVTAAGDVTVGAGDGFDDYFIEKTVGSATNFYLPSAASRAKPLRIIDSKGDANTNNITIIPEAGETIFAIVDYHYVIDGNGGQITLTPHPDGTGWV